jgi:hypothetical protein
MGPGLAIKALGGRRFSVLSFGIAQVAMDIEPLVGLVRGSNVLHGPTHNYLAALAIAVVVAFISPTICRPVLRRWNSELTFYRLAWLVEAESFAPAPVVAGAFAGTLSHVILDSIMHADISPLAPWSDTNALRGCVSVSALYQFCVLAGLLGALGWVYRAWRKQRLGVGGEG